MHVFMLQTILTTTKGSAHFPSLMDFPSGSRARGRQMRPFISLRLFTSYSAFLASLVLLMKMTSPVVGWRLRSVPMGAVRNRASYWASTRPSSPHHQPVSVPLSEKGELGHGVSRMQEGATLMKKAFDKESSGSLFFSNEAPVKEKEEGPRDGVADFVTAAAKAFAMGYSRGEVERHLWALDGSAGGGANQEDKATRSHWIMAVLLTMQAMEVVPVNEGSYAGEDLALRSQVRLWVNGHSFLDKYERRVVDQHTVARSVKAYSASHLLPLSLLPVSRVILLTLQTLHSHQLKYEAPLPSYPSTDPTPKPSNNPLLDFFANVARALSSALPSPASPPSLSLPAMASSPTVPLFGKVVGLWQAAVRGVMTFVARGGGAFPATA